MKVAVTGASGFIGKYVLRTLAERGGLELVAASRRTKASADMPPEVQHVPLDIESCEAVSAFALLGQPDIVIHLAWSGLPNYKSLSHLDHLPQQYRFLKSLVSDGLPSLTCVGTCFEYGLQSGELGEDLPTRPSNPYGLAKDTLRKQLEFLRRERSFALNWARLFYMFGEGQPSNSLFTQFHEAGARGDRSFKMSGGEQLRDFLPVATVAELIVALAMDVADAGVVNVCSGRPISVRSLVETWRKEHGWKIDLDLGHFPYPDFEPMAFWGAPRRLRQVLGTALKI